MSFKDEVKKHPSSLYAKEVYEICQPFFEKFNLNYFDYTRVYSDNSIAFLTSDRDWSEHATSQKYCKVFGTMSNTGIHLWKYYNIKEMIDDFSTLFNHHNPVSLVINHDNDTEYIDLAAPADNHSVIDFYFNHIDDLIQIFFYFKEKAKHLIKQTEKHRLIIPAHMRGKKTNSKTTHEEFCQFLKVKRFRMTLDSREIVFSKREYECLRLIAQGTRIKIIASQLNIEVRTV